jgi:opacity protein-like surface antigen
MKNFPILSAASLIALFAAAPATAADLGALPPPAPLQGSEPLVEWGSGWYLRGDLAYNQDTGVNVIYDEPAKRRKSFEASLGFGYKFNEYLRFDTTYEHFANRSRSGIVGQIVCPYRATTLNGPDGRGVLYDERETCNVNAGSRLDVRGGMANVYADLPTFGMFTPYIGAGLGVFRHYTSSSVKYTKTSDGSPYSADLTPANGTTPAWMNLYGYFIKPQPNIALTAQNWDRKGTRLKYTIGWSLMAGVAVDVADGLKLDVGYRYMNAGRYQTDADPRTGKTKSRYLDNHQIRVGFRYQID